MLNFWVSGMNLTLNNLILFLDQQLVKLKSTYFDGILSHVSEVNTTLFHTAQETQFSVRQ